mmetsp:Transcript_17941/g.38228  ORF Transcript_17941/g.38228 Transcript_17941/m.38228 type:complete len:213 (-) Transcript_17941:504-1142(-)
MLVPRLCAGEVTWVRVGEEDAHLEATLVPPMLPKAPAAGLTGGCSSTRSSAQRPPRASDPVGLPGSVSLAEMVSCLARGCGLAGLAGPAAMKRFSSSWSAAQRPPRAIVPVGLPGSLSLDERVRCLGRGCGLVGPAGVVRDGPTGPAWPEVTGLLVSGPAVPMVVMLSRVVFTAAVAGTDWEMPPAGTGAAASAAGAAAISLHEEPEADSSG